MLVRLIREFSLETKIMLNSIFQNRTKAIAGLITLDFLLLTQAYFYMTKIKEMVWQNTKNVVQYFLIKLRG